MTEVIPEDVMKPQKDIFHQGNDLVAATYKALGMKFGEGGRHAPFVTGYEKGVADVMSLVSTALAKERARERERCAAKAESFVLVYATSSRDLDVAMQGAAKEDAAAEIAAAIRRPS